MIYFFSFQLDYRQDGAQSRMENKSGGKGKSEKNGGNGGRPEKTVAGGKNGGKGADKKVCEYCT